MRSDIILVGGGVSVVSIDSLITDATGLGVAEHEGIIHSLVDARIGVWPSDYLDEPGFDLARFDVDIQINGYGSARWANIITSHLKRSGVTDLLHLVEDGGGLFRAENYQPQRADTRELVPA